MKKLILISVLALWLSNLLAWTSSNDTVLYTMDDLCVLSDSICFNDSTSQYEVRCDIIILENDTLKLNAGEIIKYKGHYRIVINGCLKAIGTKEEPIMLGDFSFGGTVWDGIKFFNTSQNGESILSYCIIKNVYGIEYSVGIYCENSSPIIDHCTISNMNFSDFESEGGIAIFCGGQSYPIVQYTEFKELHTCVSILCGTIYYGFPEPWQDTINYPSPLVYGCNMRSFARIYGWGFDYFVSVANGGFFDNCYFLADTTLGSPIDTIGDGICTTSSIYEYPAFWKVDGVVHPRKDTIMPVIDTTEINILPTTSKYLILTKNYPNPFNSETTIDFEIVKNNVKVSLIIYNSKGQIVNKLIDKKIYSHGKYSVIWKGNDSFRNCVSPGIYFYKLISDKQKIVKKAILIK